MLISYNWLQDFLNLDGKDPYQLAEKITRTGVEVPDRIHPEDGLKKIVVGHILDCKKVEGTHLHLTHVDVGEDEPLQIVCGAPNVAAGQNVIVALHGARIAGNEKIKKGKIRGMESYGMICALQEIGFSDSVVPEKYANGTYVFPDDAEVKPGDPVFKALGMDDYILNFDITPNRADTLSMEGAAYEVGAIIDQKPEIENVTLKEDSESWDDQLEAEVDEKIAPKYYVRKIAGIKITESPLWMQRRLWNAGIRPINNVVDVTNYVMLLTGQPMHAYDARAFKNGKLEVRKAHQGEKLTLLNDKEVELDPNDIVITDGQKPVTMAGVMGGENSEVVEDTTTVYLESAVFDGTLVRKSALRHANRTESSSRFEKGINWDNTQKAIDIAALLLKNQGAKVAGGILKATDAKRQPVVVKTTVSYINKVLGTQISAAEMVKILQRLCFAVENDGNNLVVTIPNRRWDISIPADLVEEVGRLYGYDNIKSTQPLLAETHGGYSKAETNLRKAKRIVQGQGMMEAISYSLTTPEKAVRYTPEPKDLVQVAMPLTSARSTMRQSLMTGLVDAASYNFARKQTQLHFYEQGRVYDHENGKFNEHEHLATLYAGNTFSENWQHTNQKVDFFFVKGQLEDLFTELGIDNDQVVYEASSDIDGMHPTRTAVIKIDKKIIGVIGMIDRTVTMQEKALRGSELYGYELDLDKLNAYLTKGMTAKPAPKFPTIERDLSILVDKSTTNAEVETVIKENSGKYLHQLDVIDVYDGPNIDNSKKSLAYSLRFLNEKDTLTDKVVNKAMDKITAALEDKLNVKIR